MQNGSALRTKNTSHFCNSLYRAPSSVFIPMKLALLACVALAATGASAKKLSGATGVAFG